MNSFLIDENISRKLLILFKEGFSGSRHVFEVGLIHVDDREIWNFAKAHNFCILTKDWDFQVLSVLEGCPPKVVRLNCGNQTTNRILSILKDKLDIINEFLTDTESCYLEIE